MAAVFSWILLWNDAKEYPDKQDDEYKKLHELYSTSLAYARIDLNRAMTAACTVEPQPAHYWYWARPVSKKQN